MIKIKITEEQEKAIDWYLKEGDKETFLEEHAMKGFPWELEFESLNGLCQMDLARALLIGYEVDKPSFKSGDWVYHEDTKVVKVVEGALADFFNHNYIQKDRIRHATPEEIKAEQERLMWEEVEKGDIVRGVNSGRYAEFVELVNGGTTAIVLLREDKQEHWAADLCQLYAKKVNADD